MAEATFRMDPLSVCCWGGVCFLRKAYLQDGFVRLKRTGMRHSCRCEISCWRRDIGWCRLGEWLNNPTVDSWLLVFFSRLSLLRCNVTEWH
jgi:hypothetical protein